MSAAVPRQRWGCPNNPPCVRYFHDVWDFDDPVPTCCEEGYRYGKTDERLRHELLYATPEAARP